MGLHHATKKAAVAKYAPLLAEGKDEAAIRAAIAADEKVFTPAEVDEIYEALNTPDDQGAGSSAEKSADENKGKYIVKAHFRDISDFTKGYHEGDDVSHFDQARLDHLVQYNLVEKQ